MKKEDKSMKTKVLIAAAVLAIAAAPGCTNKEGETEAPVFITVSLELQPGFVDVRTPAPVQINTIILASHLKNSTQTDPQGFANTQNRVESVFFDRPGRYLVICNVTSHFRNGMFSFVKVIDDDDDD